ncbi:MAG: PASTA domain-containing protein [Bacteroidota bacterium]
MAAKTKTRFSRSKIPLVTLAVLILLFFLFDDVVMPRFVQHGMTTSVPNVIGVTYEEAVRILSGQGLEGKQSEIRADRLYPEGIVILQTPPANAQVKYGRGIYLTISGGEVLIPVPGLRGRTIRDATFTLERSGLTFGSMRYEPSDEYPQGTVIDQNVAEGTKVSAGHVIHVVVSMGKSGERVQIPDVLRKSYPDAERLIIQAGLKIGNVTYQLSVDLLPNTVMDQYPRPGDLVIPGQAIDLFVSKKAEPPTNEN